MCKRSQYLSIVMVFIIWLVVFLGGNCVVGVDSTLFDDLVDNKGFFQPSSSIVDYISIRNPMRGVYTHHETSLSSWTPLEYEELLSLRGYRPISTVLRDIKLDSLFTQPNGLLMPEEWFYDFLEADLLVAQRAGFSVLLKFSYSNDPDVDSIIETLVRIMTKHVANKYSDIVLALQLGFGGVDGDWWESNLFGSATERSIEQNSLVNAVIESALSATSEIPQVRILVPQRQMKTQMFGLGSVASDPSDLAARIGYYDPCLFGNDNFFVNAPNSIAEIELDSRLSMVVGHICSLPSNVSTCFDIIDGLIERHVSLLSESNAAIDIMIRDDCLLDIVAHLGYYLVVSFVEAPMDPIHAGSVLPLRITLTNEGSAAPPQVFDVELVMHQRNVNNSSSEFYYVGKFTDVDPRSWVPQSSHVFSGVFVLPEDLDGGIFDVFVLIRPKAMTSHSEAVRASPHYRIKFLNADVYDEITGLNRLPVHIVVIENNNVVALSSPDDAVLLQPVEISSFTASEDDIRTSVLLDPSFELFEKEGSNDVWKRMGDGVFGKENYIGEQEIALISLTGFSQSFTVLASDVVTVIRVSVRTRVTSLDISFATIFITFHRFDDTFITHSCSLETSMGWRKQNCDIVPNERFVSFSAGIQYQHEPGIVWADDFEVYTAAAISDLDIATNLAVSSDLEGINPMQFYSSIGAGFILTRGDEASIPPTEGFVIKGDIETNSGQYIKMELTGFSGISQTVVIPETITTKAFDLHFAFWYTTTSNFFPLYTDEINGTEHSFTLIQSIIGFTDGSSRELSMELNNSHDRYTYASLTMPTAGFSIHNVTILMGLYAFSGGVVIDASSLDAVSLLEQEGINRIVGPCFSGQAMFWDRQHEVLWLCMPISEMCHVASYISVSGEYKWTSVPFTLLNPSMPEEDDILTKDVVFSTRSDIGGQWGITRYGIFHRSIASIDWDLVLRWGPEECGLECHHVGAEMCQRNKIFITHPETATAVLCDQRDLDKCIESSSTTLWAWRDWDTVELLGEVPSYTHQTYWPAAIDESLSIMYMGCFVITSDKTSFVISLPFQTPEMCVDLCKSNGYRYAGLVGDICHCDNSFEVFTEITSGGCDMPCSGNPAFQCGNIDGRVSLWDSDSTTDVPRFGVTRNGIVSQVGETQEWENIAKWNCDCM